MHQEEAEEAEEEGQAYRGGWQQTNTYRYVMWELVTADTTRATVGVVARCTDFR